MNLYFFNFFADPDPTNINNWYEDSSQITPASYLPSGSDAVFIQSGVCATSNFTRGSLTVESGGALTINPVGYSVDDNNGTIDENQGSVLINDGTITLNGSYGNITTNNGIVSSNLSTVTHNYGQVNGNAGEVTTNYAGGIVTPPPCGYIVTNNGVAYIPGVGGGSGQLASVYNTSLVAHTSSGTVDMPTGGSTILGPFS